MKTILLLIAFAGMVEPINYKARAAALLVLSRKPAPAPTPAPAPVGICSNCKGTGKLGDGTIVLPCPVCGGDGRVDAQATPPAYVGVFEQEYAAAPDQSPAKHHQAPQQAPQQAPAKAATLAQCGLGGCGAGRAVSSRPVARVAVRPLRPLGRLFGRR